MLKLHRSHAFSFTVFSAGPHALKPVCGAEKGCPLPAAASIAYRSSTALPSNRRRLKRCTIASAAVADDKKASLQLEVRFDDATEDPPPTFLKTSGRIIAIGDIHGDINKAIGCLELSGVAEVRDGAPIWIGGDTIVVQLGDVLDRGDAEVATVMLLRQLHRQAVNEGGAIYMLNGNHESLNVCGDFRYVTEGAFIESGMVMGLQGPNLQNIDLLVRARLALYAPGQHMAKELSKNPTVLVINDTVFAHGGLLPLHVKYGLEKINAEVAAWMRADVVAEGGFAPPPFIAMGDSKSIMWNRTFGKEKWVSPVDRKHAVQLLDNALLQINCERLVVGHTPQMEGANSECDGKVWRLDVGMSRGMLDAPATVLEITPGLNGSSSTMRILSGDP